MKAASESNAEVGDRANDAHRINGSDIGAKVVGEGANLGVTQAGRIEFAMNGGRINTDFIDNSAGVDCSDNEVNIKIALNGEVTAGRLSEADRDTLLVEMTDDVADLVLKDNILQTQALSIAERGGNAALAGHIRLIEALESSAAELDRQVEGLASDEQLRQRGLAGGALERPELAVVMAYAKMAIYDALVESPAGRGPAAGARPAQWLPRRDARALCRRHRRPPPAPRADRHPPDQRDWSTAAGWAWPSNSPKNWASALPMSPRRSSRCATCSTSAACGPPSTPPPSPARCISTCTSPVSRRCAARWPTPSAAPPA